MSYLMALQDLVEELAKPGWYADRKGEVPAGAQPYHRLPIFNYYKVPHLFGSQLQQSLGQSCSFPIAQSDDEVVFGAWWTVNFL